jgi:hypothetical protein
MNTDIEVPSYAIEIVRWGKSDEATSGKQNAKRSQRAGRLKIERTRQKDNIREPSVLDEVLRSRDRFKRVFAVRASFKRVKGDGFKSPITESQERVFGV